MFGVDAQCFDSFILVIRLFCWNQGEEEPMRQPTSPRKIISRDCDENHCSEQLANEKKIMNVVVQGTESYDEPHDER